VLEHADTVRRQVSPRINQTRKAEFGQFMTPAGVARFMASLFSDRTLQTCRLLDPGAGIGALSCAFLDRLTTGRFRHIEVAAFEIDSALRAHLEKTLSGYAARLPIQPRIVAGDFIEHAVRESLQGQGGYTHAILNPPYKKINSNSQHRHELRRIGIETVNLYSAFAALTLALLAPGGQLVAIIPRSFCNGPYYRPFRDFVLERAAIRHMHLFDSRSKAFRDDDVLQENVIIMLERGGAQGDVTVSTSTDDSFADLTHHTHPFNRIVFPDDPARFIHVPTSHDRNAMDLSPLIRCTLDDLGIKVSTGPVVDFRVRKHIRDMPGPGTVPLLYPGHFIGQGTEWPKPGLKKPNAIERNDDTEKWLYPTGCYCVVRRFSSKEERRRIVASVVEQSAFSGAAALGFENHLNVFHQNRQGLPASLARGLAMFLNTSAVDEQFRRYNGHTQVNATDLRQMKYPSRAALLALGKRAAHRKGMTQAEIDRQLEKLTA
jgi:adenine-specific DNA-methyltransferase